MSSEEMRNDLENFVNRGLSEGWGGWPMKGLSLCREELNTAYDAIPPAAALLRGVGQRPLRHARSPVGFTRTTSLDRPSRNLGFGRPELS